MEEEGEKARREEGQQDPYKHWHLCREHLQCRSLRGEKSQEAAISQGAESQHEPLALVRDFSSAPPPY